ncbi:unnamed protein product [Paramecium octaurelia]|uniref:Transmembrane protein n=1 Tax=Paramecium octaurelia TaxID=43137 RepID=A0A8S1VHE2_PAROT|nr:unnamed protein product [Paramecium octaurelia]
MDYHLDPMRFQRMWRLSQILAFQQVLCLSHLIFKLSFVFSPFNMIKTRLMLSTKDSPCRNRHHYSGQLIPIHKFKNRRPYQIQQNNKLIWFMLDHPLWHSELGQGLQLNCLFLNSHEHEKQGIKIQTELNMFASANATLWLCLFTCPVKVALTRYFNQQFYNEIIEYKFNQYRNSTVYKGCSHVIKIIFYSEGFLGLYKGLWGLFFRSGPQSFISLLILNQQNNLRNQKKQ